MKFRNHNDNIRNVKSMLEIIQNPIISSYSTYPLSSDEISIINDEKH